MECPKTSGNWPGQRAILFRASQHPVEDSRPPAPRTEVVDPGEPGQAPSDATVLFAGKDLSSGQEKMVALRRGPSTVATSKLNLAAD